MSETITYTVPAIHCAHCAMSIREEVSEIEGVEDVDVDVDSKLVTVKGLELDDAALRSAIVEAGTRQRELEHGHGARDRARKEVRLDLEGMTCASCVRRIERKLNKLDGVEATVNFATEQATVHCDPSVAVDDLVSAVEAAGYHAHPVDESRGHHHHDEAIATLRRRPERRDRSPRRSLPWP